MTQTEYIAYTQGIEAAKKGEPSFHNPYKRFNESLTSAWHKGWSRQVEEEMW